MRNEVLRHVLRSLNWHAFSAYVRELFSLRESSRGDNTTTITITDLPRIGEYAFEQRVQRGLDTCSFTAVFPHPLPIDLLKDPQSTCLFDPSLKRKIEQYRRRSARRGRGWFFPSMGSLTLDGIAVISNVEGLPQKTYADTILPQLEILFEKLKYEAEPMLGTIDSFVTLSAKDARRAFDQFTSKYVGALEISLSSERFSIHEAIPGKYIMTGAFGPERHPSEPVFLRHFRLNRDVIAEFEELLNADPDERRLERFLRANYREVFGSRYDRIETQLWLRVPELDRASKTRRLDILLRNSVEDDWDLFEIKRPIRLTRTYRDVPVLTAEVINAMQQVRNYASILSQDHVRRLMRQQGIDYCEPSLHLVVGRAPEIPTSQWRWLKSTACGQIKLLTYDTLLREMKTRLESFEDGFVCGQDH